MDDLCLGWRWVRRILPFFITTDWISCASTRDTSLSYTLRMKTLFHGWPVMVHGTHTRRRTVSPPPLFLLSDAEWNECTGWQNCEFDSCTFFSAVERGRLVTRHIAQTHRWRQHPNGRLDMAQYLCHMATCRWHADIINHNACQRQRLTVWDTTVCILSANHHEICTVTIIKKCNVM